MNDQWRSGHSCCTNAARISCFAFREEMQAIISSFLQALPRCFLPDTFNQRSTSVLGMIVLTPSHNSKTVLVLPSLLYFLFIFYFPWCTVPDFPSASPLLPRHICLVVIEQHESWTLWSAVPIFKFIHSSTIWHRKTDVYMYITICM